MMLILNMVQGSFMATIAEGLTLAQATGQSQQTFLDILCQGQMASTFVDQKCQSKSAQGMFYICLTEHLSSFIYCTLIASLEVILTLSETLVSVLYSIFKLSYRNFSRGGK